MKSPVCPLLVLREDIRDGRGRWGGLLKDVGARVDQDVAEALPRLGREGGELGPSWERPGTAFWL